MAAVFDNHARLCRNAQVEGTTVVDTNAGGLEGSKWEFLGHNLALLLMFRVGVFFFLRYSLKTCRYW